MLRRYRAGHASTQIAEWLKVSNSTVVKRLRKLGVRLRNPKDAACQRTISGRTNPSRCWKGKKQSAAHVEDRISKIRGANHYLWKGGKDQRHYRKVVTKEKCSLCEARMKLGIHHKDYDHYNNAPGNLQVLCLSCHMALHKKAHWKAIKEGLPPPKSNGRVGWQKSKS